MKRKAVFIILAGLIVIAVVLKLIAMLLVEPWIRKTIETSFNKENSHYNIEIQHDRIHFFPLGINIENVRFYEHVPASDSIVLAGEFPSIFFSGFHLFKAIFSRQLIFQRLIIGKGNFSGRILRPQKSLHAFPFPFTLDIRKVSIDSLDFNLLDSASTKLYALRQGKVRAEDFQVLKGDVLAHFTTSNFDFYSPQITFQTPDSLYTLKADSINYSTLTETLFIPHFLVHPNYKGYDFTSRLRFQSDRIEANVVNITVNGFCANDFWGKEGLTSSFIQIEKVSVDVFRDRRKEFRHTLKPLLQDVLYKYTFPINVDSVRILNGDVTYTEHADGAHHPGSINFQKVRASIYSITNDTIHPHPMDTMVINTEALVYGKAMIKLVVMEKLFNPTDAFSMKGSLAPMQVEYLNPILSKNAFIYANGNVKGLHFNFIANKFSANGTASFLYDNLHIALKSKETDDTTGFKQVLISKLANKKIKDANPLPGEDVRIGSIHFKRDPEKTIFSYCLKAIMSGIKSTMDKPSKKKK